MSLDTIHPSWKPIIEEIEKSSTLDILNRKVLPYIQFFPTKENIFRVFKKPVSNILEHLENQGVFLLNTALTVKEGEPGSHLVYWKEFTKKVISFISNEVQPIFLLWENHAQEYSSVISNKQDILKCSHPASELYSKGTFLGCNHFKITNKILSERNLEEILW